MYIYYHIYSCSTHFSFASLYVWFSRFVLHGAALALPGTFVPFFPSVSVFSKKYHAVSGMPASVKTFTFLRSSGKA